MAGTATPIFPQTIKTYAAQLLTADGTTKKTLVTAGANGSRVDAINAASTDTTARDLQLWITQGGTDYLLGTVQLPINAGNTNASPSVDVLRSAQIPGLAYDANGNRVIYLGSGAVLKVAVLAAVTAAKELDVIATTAGDY